MSGEVSEGVIELNPLTVQGSRLTPLHAKAASTVELTVSEDLGELGLSDLGSFLNGIAGIYYNPRPSGAGASELWMRGGETNFVRVEMDGVPLNNVLDDRGGTFDLNQFELPLISRVSVQQGPGTAFSGSGALSGVVSLESFVPMVSVGGLFDLGFSTAGQRSGALRWDQIWGRSHLHLDTGASEQIWNNDQGERQQKQIGLGFTNQLSDQFFMLVSMRGMRLHAEAFPADSGGVEWSVIRDLEINDSETLIGSIRLGYDAAEGQKWRIRFYGFSQESAIWSPGVAPGMRDPGGLPSTRSDNRFLRYGLASDYSFFVGDHWQFAFGGEIEREDGETESLYDFGFFSIPAMYALVRTTKSIAVEARWEREAWIVSYAFRGDDSDRSGRKISQQIRADWVPEGSQWALGASAQDGFKFASLYALSNALVGNPDLRSEKVTSVALHGRLVPENGNWLVEVTIFSAEYRDLIDFDSGPPPALINRDRVTSSGFDLRVEWRISSLKFSGYLSHSATDEAGSEEPLHDRPRWRGGFGVEWQISDSWRAILRGTHVGTVHDSSIPTGEMNLEPYVRCDLLASAQIDASSEAWLRIENVFDVRYAYSVGSPAPGIGLAVGWNRAF